MFDALGQDVRYSWRSLRRTPAFFAAAVVTLALGIGLTTAIYSVVDAVLVRPIPYPDHGRLVVVWETDRDSGTTREPGSFPDLVGLTRVTGAGLVAGTALGLVLAQELRRWLYGISTTDTATLAGALTVLTLVAAASSYFPTRRAARIDPALALRAD